MRHATSLFLAVLAGLAFLTTASLAAEPAHPAQLYRAAGEPVQPAPDGQIICEAEEFKVVKPGPGAAQGWVARNWGENYYAATFANTFLSRKAFLGAPEDCDETMATINVNVKEAGRYLVLARYEAPYRFEARFSIKIEQNGKEVFNQLFGARNNVKVWAFGERLKAEVAWPWGAVENLVWEGYLGEGINHYAELQPGLAKVSLVAGRQPGPRGKRNVDLVMLTRNEADIKLRVEQEGPHLPIDGILTQAGDVWARVTNTGGTRVTVKHDGWQEHSPYWVHMRTWEPWTVEVEPGQTSEWIDAGGPMDSLNDGQWAIGVSGPCRIEFGVKSAAGEIETVKEYTTAGNLKLIGLADMRYAKKVQTPEEGLAELLAYLKALPMHGKTPAETIIIGSTFGDSEFAGRVDQPASYIAKAEEFKRMFALKGIDFSEGYGSWGGMTPAQLEAECLKLPEAVRKDIRVVSLGDEIGLPAPDGEAATDGFTAYLKAQGLTPNQVDPTAGKEWANVKYNADAGLKETSPGLYYWSQRYRHHYGIQEMKKQTDALRKHLPNARIGANFSPHHGGYVHSYLGEVFQWVDCFRNDGMTLPWAEDYIWQVPVGTPQMNGINLDLFRAGIRGKPDRKILYYVMPHMPGNTPNMWRRLFYNALGHGMSIVNLFEFRPVWSAYTENHVTGNEMYGTILKTFRELGMYEDIVQSGQVRPAEVGLWFSETADIWGDNQGSFAANKRAMYKAILDRQVPLDFIVEGDALDGTLNRYKALYLTDNHVSQAASRKIADWVRNGGMLFATAGAGMFDEYNRPNTALQAILGVDVQAIVSPRESHIGYIKEDLPFAQACENVTIKQWAMERYPVFGTISRVTARNGATVIGTFDDNNPAIVQTISGKGQALYCAFLPGLSYFKPAIPMKPLDRGTSDDAMAHFIPTDFDPAVGKLINTPVATLTRPVVTSEPLVEVTVIESKAGTLITLANWSGKPIEGLTVTINIPAPMKKVETASGTPVNLVRQSDLEKRVYTLDLDVADALILR
ncbi:MAG: beta-galactosidase trimerization domain-containing protein [Armatimonadota bacterium]